MSNDRILRTLQQDVEIPEVVRKKADQAFARIHAEQEKTEPDNRKVVSYNLYFFMCVCFGNRNIYIN